MLILFYFWGRSMCFFFRRQAAQMLRELCKQHVALCPDRDGDVGSYTLAMEKNEKKMNMGHLL